jgi:hypothetical protein
MWEEASPCRITNGAAPQGPFLQEVAHGPIANSALDEGDGPYPVSSAENTSSRTKQQLPRRSALPWCQEVPHEHRVPAHQIRTETSQRPLPGESSNPRVSGSILTDLYNSHNG